MEDNIKSQTKMKEIPAFTVLKNNSILKNICLLHKQHSSSNQDSDEQILLVGRHPNCNITLEHPSISRYHLRIHSTPSTHSFSVFDLSSVHGTWVSGKRIEPGVHVELKEGDTVKMGGSSRVYELHWVPVSRAFDDDGQFMSTIYTINEGEEEMNLDEKLEFHLSDDELECSELSFSDMIHHDWPVQQLDLLTSSDPDCLTSSCDDTEVECSSPSKAGNRIVPGIEDSDGLNTSENQPNWSSDSMSNELNMLNRESDKDGPLSCDDTVLFQPTLVVSETISAIEDSVSLNKSEDELNWLMDNLINEFELQNDGIIEEIPFSVSNCLLSESEDDMNWLRDNLSNEFELQNHGIINRDPFSVPNCSKSFYHDSPVKKLNLLTFSDPDCLTSSCDDTEVECSSPSKTGNGIISGIKGYDDLNTSENQSNLSSDNMSDDLKMANHETHKDGPLSVSNCSKSSCADTALFQPPLVVPETIFAIQDSVSLKFSSDELSWLMDNLSYEFELQNDGSIKEDPFSVLNFSLSGSEDELDWLRDNLSNEFDLENHGIINEGPFSVPNCSKSFCNVTELEHLSPWFSETISAIEDSASLNNSADRLNRLEDILSDDFKLIRDVFSVPRCSKSSSHDSKVASPWQTGNENVQIFDTISSQSPLISETEMSDSLIKSDDQMNWLNDNLISEFELQNHEIIKEDQFSIPNCSKSSCHNTEVEYSSPWKTEIFDGLNKPEAQLNWLRDNLSNESEQLSYGTMKDGLVSIACFNATKVHEKDALTQDIEKRDEIVMGNENEPVNEQTNNVSDLVALSNDVNRDEGGSFMPDTAESKEAHVDSEYEQMNHTVMADESASVVLIDGVDMGYKVESINHERTKKESVFMALPEGTDLDQEPSFTTDISTAKEVHTDLEVMKNVSVSMNLSNTLDRNRNELEIFTPDIENKNPNACSVKPLKKGWMEDVSSPTVNEEKDYISFSKELLTNVDESYGAFLQRSLFDVDKVDPFVYSEEALFSSSEKETKSRKLEMEGSCYSIQSPQTVQNAINSSHNILGGAKKRWTMVVDTSSLLHVESLKHLKLLEGLKGTQIAIPKIVIRELVDIQSQDNLLRRSTEKVTLALEWINTCMVNTRWWILMDNEILLSSSEETQVLETALHLRKETTDREVIILSNDLKLKIKAMAEGIMCEAAEEFLRSLVNPFSKRFMWVGSLARGLTWSCVNDDILRQKYHGCGFNGSHGLKDLKLLAHDTAFRQDV